METKKCYTSKTMWAGFLEIVSGILFAVSGELNTGSTLTTVGILTIILRAVTKNAITK